MEKYWNTDQQEAVRDNLLEYGRYDFRGDKNAAQCLRAENIRIALTPTIPECLLVRKQLLCQPLVINVN